MISISTIFQSETTALEAQVSALQAQIAAHTERITLLNETELLAGGSQRSTQRCDSESDIAPQACDRGTLPPTTAIMLPLPHVCILKLCVVL